MSAAYSYPLTVPPQAIDANGHANNVEFVRWMQDAAVAHSDSTGCTRLTRQVNAAWVVRRHRIEYFRPALLGDALEVRTWVADFRRAFSLRKYQVIRPADQTVLATGETDWVFIDTQTGRPKSVPPEIQSLFEILCDAKES